MEQTDKRKQDKLKFDRVINLARRLPQPAIHDLLRALIESMKNLGAAIE
ncbi:hypothetical protein [Serratia marcescens]|nr:hypothetical protein [Serratia marcescens]